MIVSTMNTAFKVAANLVEDLSFLPQQKPGRVANLVEDLSFSPQEKPGRVANLVEDLSSSPQQKPGSVARWVILAMQKIGG